MLKQFRRFLNPRNEPSPTLYRPVTTPAPRALVITEASVLAMRECMAPEITCGHEGIAYLLGQTNGSSTIVVGAIRPVSRTTRGSFDVSSIAMARVVRAATDAGLQVIGQIHTHPKLAFHSNGDIDGARIAYDGYISIVVPEYGRLLPSLSGAAIYFHRDGAFSKLGDKAVRVITGVF
jgi:proteasome lid subunit RPN8/RPN11